MAPVHLRREGPYRQPATARAGALDARPPLSRQLLAFAALAVALGALAAPVVALAAQPFSTYATLVTGALAAWTAVAVLRVAFSTD